MRLAPVPLFYSSAPLFKVIEICGESSKTTHGAQTAVDGCRFLGALIHSAVNGRSKNELLSDVYNQEIMGNGFSDVSTEIKAVMNGTYKVEVPLGIVGSGYVVKSLEAALWAFSNTKNFEDGCLMAVNLGDDADTTGAVYGQLAGAYYGLDGIPKKWIETVAFSNLLTDFGHRLISASEERSEDG